MCHEGYKKELLVSGLRERIQNLIAQGDVKISEHGYDELAEDGLTAREVVAGVTSADIVEEYPDFPKGPSVLLLQRLEDQTPVHVVWGIPRGHQRPAVLITAYRPDAERWDQRLLRRL